MGRDWWGMFIFSIGLLVYAYCSINHYYEGKPMPKIEPGVYDAVMSDWGAGMSKNDKPYIWTKHNITDLGEERTVYSYFSPACFDNSFGKLKVMGFNGDFTTPDFTERDTKLVCRHEEYDGKMKEKWDFEDWGDGDGGTFEHTDFDQKTAMELNAQWKNASKDTPTDGAVDKARSKAWDAFKATEDKDDTQVWYSKREEMFPDTAEGDMKAEDWSKFEGAFELDPMTEGDVPF